MIKCPYMKISQRDEVFFLTKFRASDLKKLVNFHFRQAYSNEALEEEPFAVYLEKVKNKGINLYASPEGIQRRLQLDKLKKIKEYLESTQDSFFPNTIILSADLSNDDDFMNGYLEIEKNDVGFFEFPDSVKFQIVDGQHRLAGLFMSNETIQHDFEIPVVLLINITLSTCAKIFADVNGNQSPVNKSVIYDLYELMGNSQKNQEYGVLHGLCKSLNEDSSSPLYQHVKMLGIGGGAVSQSFLANAFKEALTKLQYQYKDDDNQKMYENIYLYLKCYQRVFQNQWAVLENFPDTETFRTHSEKIMKKDKSQALKTNGLGAIVRAFPIVYKAVERKNYQSYFEIVNRLKGKIDWCSEDLRKGTGDKTQKAICDILLKGMNLKMRKAIVFPKGFTIVNIDYNSKEELYVATIVETTDGLNVAIPPQKGKIIENTVALIKEALEYVNNQSSFVIDIPDSFNENTLIHDCQNLLDVELHLINSAYPEVAFKAIENDGIEGKIVNKDCRIYSADSIWKILEILKDGDITNYQYNYVKKNP